MKIFLKASRMAVLIVAVLCPACFLSGCGSKTKLYGQPIVEKNITPIGDILANPAQFSGKTVKIQGKIAQECPSGCWFMLQDESGTLYVNIHPSNLVIPQAIGHQASVAGVVEKEGAKVSLIGNGVELK